VSLLLDTYAFLWWRANDPRLAAGARRAIAEADVVFVSVASAWEAAVKIGLGRLRLPAPFERGVVESGFERLGITFEHTQRVADMPPHHRDPFDRMLIAQALVEGLTVVTHDEAFRAYGVDALWT
jgi:PIN domain nuclease of toxin-antitoxin system